MSDHYSASVIRKVAVEQYVQLQESGETNMLHEENVRKLADSYGFDELVSVIDEDNYSMLLENYNTLREHYNV